MEDSENTSFGKDINYAYGQDLPAFPCPSALDVIQCLAKVRD